jgi:cytochrome c-type biogenesis protein CcmH
MFLVALLASAPVRAVEPDEILSDPALEARARALSHNLRCMVCQNQSIDDSNAPLARDLRILVRERLQAGDDDNQVIDFLVARYGEFVLLKPRLTWHTAILWGAPVTLLVAGAMILFVFARRRGGTAVSAAVALSPEEQARVSQLTQESEQ